MQPSLGILQPEWGRQQWEEAKIECLVQTNIIWPERFEYREFILGGRKGQDGLREEVEEAVQAWVSENSIFSFPESVNVGVEPRGDAKH